MTLLPILRTVARLGVEPIALATAFRDDDAFFFATARLTFDFGLFFADFISTADRLAVTFEFFLTGFFFATVRFETASSLFLGAFLFAAVLTFADFGFVAVFRLATARFAVFANCASSLSADVRYHTPALSR